MDDKKQRRTFHVSNLLLFQFFENDQPPLGYGHGNVLIVFSFHRVVGPKHFNSNFWQRAWEINQCKKLTLNLKELLPLLSWTLLLNACIACIAFGTHPTVLRRFFYWELNRSRPIAALYANWRHDNFIFILIIGILSLSFSIILLLRPILVGEFAIVRLQISNAICS